MENNGGADTLLLVMRQQQSRYAVPAKNVEEIIAVPAITVLPLQPEHLRGVFSYKGHVIPALSLQSLCGCGTGEQETVCVVLSMDGLMFALTADSAESLTADSGQRMKYDESLLEGKLVKLDGVMPGDPAIFILSLKKVCQALESDFNS